jgi:hypothetical protein
LDDEHIALVDIVIADPDEIDENHAAAHPRSWPVASSWLPS